jgi:hypothetical protein
MKYVTCSIEARLALYSRLGSQRDDERADTAEEKKTQGSILKDRLTTLQKKTTKKFKPKVTIAPKPKVVSRSSKQSAMKDFIKNQKMKLAASKSTDAPTTVNGVVVT